MRGFGLVVCLSALVTAGCATVGRLSDPDYFRKQSSMQLCMDLLSTPTLNVNRGARMEELARRGENCSQYTGQAAVQVQRDRQTTDSLIEASKALTPPPAPRPTTCNWFAGRWVCQ